MYEIGSIQKKNQTYKDSSYEKIDSEEIWKSYKIMYGMEINKEGSFYSSKITGSIQGNHQAAAQLQNPSLGIF